MKLAHQIRQICRNNNNNNIHTSTPFPTVNQERVRVGLEGKGDDLMSQPGQGFKRGCLHSCTDQRIQRECQNTNNGVVTCPHTSLSGVPGHYQLGIIKVLDMHMAAGSHSTMLMGQHSLYLYNTQSSYSHSLCSCQLPLPAVPHLSPPSPHSVCNTNH